MKNRYRLAFLVVPMLVWVAGCGSTRYSTDVADYGDEIQDLNRALLDNPNDPDALADLGVIYVRTQQYGRGSEYLQRAFGYRPDDPKVLYHLGVASEALGKTETALRLYGKYGDVPRHSSYRDLMEGRYQLLVRRQVRADIKELLAQEAQRADAPTSPRIVAVFPFVYQGDDDHYAPLGRGLGEMVTVDLANIRDLTLVERIRLQVLLDELKLGQSGFVDPATAPRVGHLLGAGRIVGGSYNVLGDRQLRMDADVVALQEGAGGGARTTSGALDRLFELEKELVFNVVDELGVQLTPDERDEIEKVPTRNLQAFLAYSRGLQEEDAGNFGRAAAFFNTAAGLDPSFDAAVQQADAAGSLSSAQQVPTPEGAAAMAARLEGPSGPTINLLDDRILNLTSTLGAGFLPSNNDSREPAAEAASSGEESPLGTRLPDPPRPTSGGN